MHKAWDYSQRSHKNKTKEDTHFTSLLVKIKGRISESEGMYQQNLFNLENNKIRMKPESVAW